MSKGLNIRIKGKAEKIFETPAKSKLFAIKPTDFPGLTPKLNLKEGAEVKAGDCLFFDKYRPEVKFTSPVSGKVVAINRGERRKILEIVVESDGQHQSNSYPKGDPADMQAEDIKKALLDSGFWPFFKQRPYGIVASPEDKPKNIHISCFDTSPLAPDFDYIAQDSKEDFQLGVNALKKLTDGKIHLGLNAAYPPAEAFEKSQGVEKHYFRGKHPAGNVGVQVHHIDPVNKGDIVWTVGPQEVINIGRLFKTGKYAPERIVALSGSEVKKPRYYKTLIGASITPMTENNLKSENMRYISGNPLTGTKIAADGYLGFHDSQITVIPEGDRYRFFGWLAPGFKRYSTSHAYLSWLLPGKKFSFDTNYNGGHRAYVMTGEYENVTPMDILPQHLIKAIMVQDIDQMENLGIYEVIEEDLALCEFVCTSKTEVQQTLREGIELMIKELG